MDLTPRIGKGGQRKVSKAYADVMNDANRYDDEEIAFLKAMDAYKRNYRRPFPTWCEVLKVLKSLGYRRTKLRSEGGADPRPLDGRPRTFFQGDGI